VGDAAFEFQKMAEMQETGRLITPHDLFAFSDPRRGGRNFLTRFLIQTHFLISDTPKGNFNIFQIKILNSNFSKIKKKILKKNFEKFE